LKTKIPFKHPLDLIHLPSIRVDKKFETKADKKKRRKQIETNIPQKNADYFSKRITKSDYFLKKSKSKFFCKLNAKTRNF